MKKHPNLVLGALLILFVGLGAMQGRRVDHLRDSEQFYRWIVGASNQLRLEGRVGPDPTDPEIQDKPPFKDKELFDKVVALADTQLPDIPLGDDDNDKMGKPMPRLVRYNTIRGRTIEGQAAEEAQTVAERIARDKVVWAWAEGPGPAQEREEFLQSRYDKKLWAVAQLGASDLYQNPDVSISLGNVFFGFRKMAANLIWLQVDRYWHEGALFRMVPLMKTTVTLDPTFVDAYLIGAWHLAYNITAPMAPTPEPLKEYYPRYRARLGDKERYYYSGIDFLKEGIQDNPRDYRLYFDLGYAIYDEKLNDYPHAVRYLSEAIRLKHDRWVERALFRCLQYNGQYDEALAGWKRYIEKFKDTATDVAPRFIIYNDAFIFERDAERQDTRANAADRIANRARDKGDATVAAQYEKTAADARAERDRLYEEARKKWQQLPEGDTFGVTRLLRLDALKCMSDGRYLEAIAKLDNARWETLSYFDEASDLIMDIKQKAGEPLTVSEKGAVERKIEALEYDKEVPKVVRNITYEPRDGVYYDQAYSGQDALPVKADTDDCDKLLMDHPDVAPILAIGDQVVFQAEGQWYQYAAAETKTEAGVPAATS